MEQMYQIYDENGNVYGYVKVVGENEEDCQKQIDEYLENVNKPRDESNSEDVPFC